ncbi:MAG: DUF488 family protein [Chloroflexi bacterium]|nr:DUF488 family protein [Chloroflexota bacterium]
MSFAHASIYEPEPENTGLRVLIMRLWPRGIRKQRIDVWMKDAAPTRELLNAYHHEGLPWDEFEARYRREILHDRPHVVEHLRRMEREHGRVTLFCYERMPPEEHCHRVTLLAMLTEA